MVKQTEGMQLGLKALGSIDWEGGSSLIVHGGMTSCYKFRIGLLSALKLTILVKD